MKFLRRIAGTLETKMIAQETSPFYLGTRQNFVDLLGRRIFRITKATLEVHCTLELSVRQSIPFQNDSSGTKRFVPDL